MNLMHHFPMPRILTRDDPFDRLGHIGIFRGPKRVASFRSGPNVVHAFITHPDGSIEDLGESHNFLTNDGRDWWSDALGGVSALTAQGSPLTAATATSATATATPFTASNLGTTPGMAGKVIVVPVTGLTTTPVFGLIGSNTTSVLTLDKWWTPDFAGTGTTPANTSAYQILPGRGAGVLFMGITTDSAAGAAADHTLASEITTGNCQRAKATYAHSYQTATSTIVNAFAPNTTFTAIHRMALFTCSTTTAGGIMVYEAVLNVDATVASGDTLTITDTITLSG